MPAIAFDTLKFVKRLRSAGFDEEKAEALSDLATKQDIKMLKKAHVAPFTNKLRGFQLLQKIELIIHLGR